jgi:hypothetical protein
LVVIVVVRFDDHLHSDLHATPALATRQLAIGCSSVEAIDLQPAEQLYEFLVVIVNSVVIVMFIAIVIVFTAAIGSRR